MERLFSLLWMLLIFYGCEQKSATYQGRDISASIDSLIAKNDHAAKYFSSATDSLYLLSDEVIAVSGKLLKMGYDSSSSIGIRKEMIRAYSNRGKLAGDRGDFSKMAADYLSALALAEQNGDTAAIVDLTGNVGAAYRMSHDRTHAIQYFWKAMELSRGLDDVKLHSKNYNLIGGVYIDLLKNDSALFYMRKSLQLKTMIADSNGMAKVYNNMGVIFSNTGMRDSSLYYFRKAADIMRTLGDKMAMGIIYDGISGELRADRKFGAAKLYLDISLSIAGEIKSDYLKEMVYFSYANLYAEMGDYRNAYEYFRKYNDIINIIRGDNNQQQIADLQNRYEKSQKDFAIAKLSSERKLAEAKLREQKVIRNYITTIALLGAVFTGAGYWMNRRKRRAELLHREAEHRTRIAEVEMKALRSQMNSHFIFNSLQSIYDFLVQKQTKEAGDYLLKFSKLIRMILNHGRKPLVTIRQEFEVLRLYMELENLRMNEPFSFSLESTADEDMPVPSLILQPLVENAIRHGLSGDVQNGEIIITARESGGQLILSVENRGQGMASRETGENHESLGLQIVKERLEIQAGTGVQKVTIHAEDLSDKHKKILAYRVTLTIPVIILVPETPTP